MMAAVVLDHEQTQSKRRYSNADEQRPRTALLGSIHTDCVQYGPTGSGPA